MTRARSDGVMQNIRTLFDVGTATGLTDAQLLERFAAGRRDASEAAHAAEAAFEALVARHGPMVLGVCRRALNRPDDVEDAFQATFLVLVRRAGSVRVGDSLGRWLYGVARRVATKARLRSECRQFGTLVTGGEPVVPSYDPARAELLAALDEELARLPSKYRAPALLCHLEGLTHAEAARRLRWPIGSVSGRLSEARAILRRRLARRGFSLSLGPLAALLDPHSLRAFVPEPMARSLIRTAVGTVGGATESAKATAAGALVSVVLQELFMFKLKVGLATLAALGIAVAGAGAWATNGVRNVGDDQTGPVKLRAVGNTKTEPKEQAEAGPPPAVESKKDALTDPVATNLARSAHRQAAAIDGLPRFSYHARYRDGTVDSMRAVDVSLDEVKEALTAPVLAKDWLGWYRLGFSWDEKRFLTELTPGETELNYWFHFWSATDSWERREANDKSSRTFVHSAAPERFWKNTDLFVYGYLRLTPHKFWWGKTLFTDQSMSTVPPERATWRHLGVEKFGGEMCDRVESSQRTEQLWIGRDSGRVRGVLSYPYQPEARPGGLKSFEKTEAARRIAGKSFDSEQDFWDWVNNQASVAQRRQFRRVWMETNPPTWPSNVLLNELALFDDYREIHPGIWLPFREVRAFRHASDTVRGKGKLIRSELIVEEVKTDTSLENQFTALLPKEGDRVQDQRFLAPVNYRYRASRTNQEIRAMAATEYEKRAKGQERVNQLVQPIAAMVGKPAPELPKSGWIGPAPPDLTGKPYLLHFWATWCAPCKNDLPRLKQLAERGVIVLGMHPSGTSREEVEKFIGNHQLGYPTFLATDKNRGASDQKIAGYSVRVFPYCIQIDAQGQVAGHGSLSNVLQGKFDVQPITPRKDDAGKSG